MKKYPFLDLALSNEPLMADLKAAACDVIESGRYLHGTQTELLEEEIAQLCQARHCVSVSNGLDALRLILRGRLIRRRTCGRRRRAAGRRHRISVIRYR